MKFMKWKILSITTLLCLVPILFGVYLWEKLPNVMAIHFDINNNPDGFASKTFVVFGLPLMMALLQIVCCFINDINAYKHGDRKKLETITKWILPVLCVILQIVTLGYALNWDLDIRKIVVVILGIMFLLIGNYLPKYDYIKNYDIETEKAKKVNRFIGFETVILGILYLISFFLSPIASIICVFLLIPYAIIGVVYTIAVCRKK